MFKNYTYLLLSLLLMPIVAFSQEQEEDSGPARRAEWERSITKDPKTGLIPRNEIEKAMTSMLKSARASAAINTINWKERGPNNVGGRTRALMFDPNDATNKKVWAGGVSGGLWYNNDITDANSSWNKVNDFWDNIAISDIAFDPSNKQIMYAGTGERGTGSVGNTGQTGTGGNGIWKTTNGGTSWTRLNSTIPDYVSTTASLAVGWREIYKILVNSTGTVFVLNMNGIYKSTDGGASWTTLGVTSGPSPSYNVLSKVTDMELGTDDILYVSEGSGDNSHQPAIYKANSSAATSFTTITPSGTFENCRVELALAPSTSGASQVIYAVGATSHGTVKMQFFQKSTDAGATWSNVTVPQHNDELDAAKPVKLIPFVGGQGDYDLILGVHATNPNIIYAAGVTFNISYDGGSSWLPSLNWYQNGQIMHSDHHAFARRPGTGNENHAIFGDDGGVSYSANWGLTPPAPSPTSNGYPTFGTRNKNYNVTQYFAIDIHNSTENIVGGTQDNGAHTITTASSTVGAGFSISGGDGALCFFDQNDPNIVITSYTHVVPFINTQGPSVASPLAVLNDEKRGKFINPADYDSPNHTLYMDYSLGTESNARIIRYHVTGSSPTYTAPNDTLTLTGIPTDISFLKLGKSTTTKTLYVGMASGDVYKVTGIPVARNTAAGDLVIPAASITKIMDKSATAEGNVSSIDYGTTDENIMVVTKSNYNIKSVFYTTNGGGAAGADWTSKDETAHGLPNIPIRYALISPLDNKNVLLATELGVWSTQDITATNPGWESTNYQTLANVRTDMLKYKASDQTVSVGTHGRGIFTGKINENLPCQIPVDLTASYNNPFVVGSPLMLYSSSRGGTSYAWSGPSSFTSAVQNPTVSSAATAAMAGVYTVTITSGSTCTATATTMVGVNPTCTPPTAVTASSNAVLETVNSLNQTGIAAQLLITPGTALNLSSSSTGGTGYAWAGPNGFTSTLQNPQVTTAAALVHEGIYTVTIRSSSATDACTATATVNIIVKPARPITQGEEVCGDATIGQLNNNFVNRSNITAYETLTSTTPLDKSALISSIITIGPGLKTVFLTTTVNGIESNRARLPFGLVHSVVRSSLLATGPVGSVLVGGTINLSVSASTTDNSTPLYSWSGPLSFTSTVQAPTVTTNATVAMAGFYGVRVTHGVNTNCTYTTTVRVSVVAPTTATVVYVNVANTNTTQNGNSWATAFRKLEDGLSAASSLSNAQVWVAKGEYKPTSNTDRTKTFSIPSGVKVFGGFVGTETLLTQRSKANETLLSGDIGTIGNMTDNSFHVVTISNGNAQTLVSGFSIKYGYAANTPPAPTLTEVIGTPVTPVLPENGGGIYIQGGSPTVSDCIIQWNSGVFGAGIFTEANSTARIEFCTISGNIATFGGGIYNLNSNTVVNNTLIVGNKALGGGFYNNNSNPVITNTTIASNGGSFGLYNTPNTGIISIPVITNSIIWNSPIGPTPSGNITYSIVQGGFTGVGNINQDPLFVAPQSATNAPITIGDYHVKANSPSINTGQNGTISLTDTDLDGNLRRYNGGVVDMGAYESQIGAGEIISIKSGNWEDPTSWNLNRVPTSADKAIIDVNHTITVTTPNAVAKNVDTRANSQVIINITPAKLTIGSQASQNLQQTVINKVKTN